MGNQCLKKIADGDKEGYKQHNQIVIDDDDELGGSLGGFRDGGLSSSSALSVASPDQVRRLVEQQMALSDELDITSRSSAPPARPTSNDPVDADDDDLAEQHEDEAFVKQGQAAWALARSQMQARISSNASSKTDIGNHFSIGDEDEDAFARELDQAMRQ